MKGKYFKYILVFGAAIIWILIGFRITKSLGKSESISVNSTKIQNSVLIPEVDTFSLQADYPDPFIPTIDSIKEDILPQITKNIPHANADSIKIIPNYDFIKYVGLISGKSKKSWIAIVNFKGEDIMMKEKDKIQEFRLKRIGKEELVFDTNGKQIKISKE